MDISSQSSNFLLQAGGGLQSQANPGQGSSAGVQNNGNPLFSGSNINGRQDILGQSEIVGQVNFDSSQLQTSPNQPAQENSSGWVDPLIFVILVVVIVGFVFGARRIFRS